MQMKRCAKRMAMVLSFFFVLASGAVHAETDYALGAKLLVDKYKKPVVYVPASPTEALPASFDWGPLAQNPLARCVTDPVRNQQSCGSCWAFASVAIFEAFTNYLYGSTTDLSEEVLVSNCCGAGSCNGGYLDQAADWMVSIGTTTESCWPYTASNGPCFGYCPDPLMGRTNDWTYACGDPWTIDINLIKEALVAHGPMATAFHVYSDFRDYNGGVYRHEYGALEGGHAVLVTGYVDNPQYPGGGYFIAKNSWGTGWAPYGGYFAIAYDSNCYFGIESTYYSGFEVYNLFGLSEEGFGQ